MIRVNLRVLLNANQSTREARQHFEAAKVVWMRVLLKDYHQYGVSDGRTFKLKATKVAISVFY